MSAKTLIVGQGGQLSLALAELSGTSATVAGMDRLDLASPGFPEAFAKLLDSQPFSSVLNAAAHTQVDKAQTDERELAFRVNHSAVAVMAQECARRQLPFVHYSTDYVFNGKGDKPWKETDLPDPINAYGLSKYEGEKAVIAAGGPCLIFRTSWVYDSQAKNFFTTILRLLHEKEELNVVADQIGAPTYAPHLAAGSLAILESFLTPLPLAGGRRGREISPLNPPASGGNKNSGIYHLCGGGATSWHGFAQAIFALARERDSGVRCRHIKPIPTSAYPLPAKRPFNSRLDCGKARETFGVALPQWEAGLKECFDASARLQASRP